MTEYCIFVMENLFYSFRNNIRFSCLEIVDGVPNLLRDFPEVEYPQLGYFVNDVLSVV